MFLLHWPLPAVLVWGAAWLLYVVAQPALGPLVAMLLASALGVAAGALAPTRWRRLLIALGFPLSLALGGAQVLPPWAWLAPLAMLALLYPVRAWRDAPVFPTPRGALAGLAGQAPLAPGAAVLDAGCGLGDGLLALQSAYPQAQLHGIEWSWPLVLACRLRCRFARVQQGDIWAAHWGGYHLVYLFQRPETMARAAAKADAEMPPGSWLVSLAFEVPGRPAAACLAGAAGQPVWLYRLSGQGSAWAPFAPTEETT